PIFPVGVAQARISPGGGHHDRRAHQTCIGIARIPAPQHRARHTASSGRLRSLGVARLAYGPNSTFDAPLAETGLEVLIRLGTPGTHLEAHVVDEPAGESHPVIADQSKSDLERLARKGIEFEDALTPAATISGQPLDRLRLPLPIDAQL